MEESMMDMRLNGGVQKHVGKGGKGAANLATKV